jgi:Fe-S-cluster-containing hydrogenase component 2
MIMQVNRELCNGCGDCLSVCSSNAIRLEGGRAVIDETLCASCQVCVDVCTRGAIAAVEARSPVVQPAALPVQRVEVLPAQPTRTSKKPIVLTALAASEILPRLAETLLNAWDRKLAQSRTTDVQTPARPAFVLASWRSSAGGRVCGDNLDIRKST